MRVIILTILLFSFSLRVLGDDIKPQKYNVLFIISDDLRAECGCYGGLAKTPNIDALAAASLRFDRGYCQFALCNPSRASMLTGRYPTATGVLGNRTNFRDAHPDWVTLPEHFKNNGYASLRAGKIFHGGIDDAKSWTEGGGNGPGDTREARSTSSGQDDSGVRQAIFAADLEPATAPSDFASHRPGPDDRQLTQAQRSDRWVVLDGDGGAGGDNGTATRTIDYLRRYKDKPFFIGCGFVKPHSPPTAPQRFYEMYDLEKIPLPPDYAVKPTVPPGFPVGSIRPRNADLFIGRDSDPRSAREMIRAYLSSISWMDWNVGRVLAELDSLGLREKTIIVFIGDHGYQLGEKGKWSKAGSVWEQGARVPFTIFVPKGNGNGKTSPRMVEMIDLYPTLAELCGLPAQKEREGDSLVPLLNDPAAAWDHPAYTVWSEDGRTLTAIAVRTPKWRYAEFTAGGGGAMLLDEAADAHEMTNLADDPKYATARGELSALVKQFGSRFKPSE